MLKTILFSPALENKIHIFVPPRNIHHILQVERIIFCTFLPIDVDIYENLLPRYFPSSYEIGKKDQSKQEPEDEKDEQITKGKNILHLTMLKQSFFFLIFRRGSSEL